MRIPLVSPQRTRPPTHWSHNADSRRGAPRVLRRSSSASPPLAGRPSPPRYAHLASPTPTQNHRPHPDPRNTTPPARPAAPAPLLLSFCLVSSALPPCSHFSVSVISPAHSVHLVSPPTSLLCRALTPTEPLMGFGRGQGPAQAANPHPNGGLLWTRRSHLGAHARSQAEGLADATRTGARRCPALAGPSAD